IAGGDLTGNYPSPTIANNAITGNKIAESSITDSKVVSVSAVKITGILPVEKGGTGSDTKNFVDLTETQIISGNKTFNNVTTFKDNLQTEGEITAKSF